MIVGVDPGAAGAVAYLSDAGELLAVDDMPVDKVQVGKPNVKGARVTAEVIDPDKKGTKVIAFKFRRREGYHRKRGIRPHHTVLKIKEIVVK